METVIVQYLRVWGRWPQRVRGSALALSAWHRVMLNLLLLPAAGLVLAGDFAPDPGLQIRLLMHETAGTTLIDASGHGRDVTLPSRDGPTRVPGGLSWTAGATVPLDLPDTVQTIRNVEIAFAGSVSAPGLGPPYEMLGGYSGADPAIGLRLNKTYSGDQGGAAAVEGWGNTWLGTQERTASGYLADVGSLAHGDIDDALHVAAFAIDRRTGTTTMYLDGEPVAPYRTGPAGSTDTAQTATAGHWQVGGASPGTSRCPVADCGYSGRIYGVSMSSTLPTAQQERTDALAWRHDIERGRGIVEAPYYGADHAAILQVSFGESWTWDLGGANPRADNYSAKAAGYLGAALGQTVTAQVDGESGIGGAIMSLACTAKLHAQARPGNGIRIAILMGRGNSLSAYGGALPTAGRWPDDALSAVGRWPDDGPLAASALADVAGLGACARQERADGYGVVLFGVSTSAVGLANDRAYKDVANPIYRRTVPRSGMVLADFANDPRVGADAAALGGADAGPQDGRPRTPVRNCTLDAGDTPGPTYQPDLNHLTVCGEQLVGHMVAAVEMAALNAGGRAPPLATVTAASSAQALAAIGGVFRLPGGARFVLLDHDGLAPGTTVATITDTGSVADTIVGGTAPNGGTQDRIDGAASYVLPPGRTAAFVVAFDGDAAGSGHITAR